MLVKIKLFLLVTAMLALCSCVTPSVTETETLPNNGLPTMLTLGAGYCQYCQAMKPVIGKLSAEYRGKVNVIYMDAQRNQEYAHRYHATGVPFVVLLDKNHHVLFTQLGYMEEGEMRHYITRYLLK